MDALAAGHDAAVQTIPPSCGCTKTEPVSGASFQFDAETLDHLRRGAARSYGLSSGPPQEADFISDDNHWSHGQ
jgi:hypothetical protein